MEAPLLHYQINLLLQPPSRFWCLDHSPEWKHIRLKITKSFCQRRYGFSANHKVESEEEFNVVTENTRNNSFSRKIIFFVNAYKIWFYLIINIRAFYLILMVHITKIENQVDTNIIFTKKKNEWIFINK